MSKIRLSCFALLIPLIAGFQLAPAQLLNEQVSRDLGGYL